MTRPPVACLTLDGHTMLVPRESLKLRPAVYGLILGGNDLLLLTMKATGKYHLPGGGLQPGELLAETLQREVLEETGLAIEVGRLAHFAELFFYYDPSASAYHGLHFFYFCRLITTALLADEEVNDGSAGKPRWVNLAGLQPADFQVHGAEILALCRGTAG